MKKRIAIVIAAIMLVAGGVQVYAATVLDSNIIALIESGFDTIRDYYVSIVDSQGDDISSKYSQQVNDHVSQKTGDVISDIEAYKNSEVNRADQEMNQYVQDLNQQADSIIDQQAQGVKDTLTQDVNKKIADMKSDIEKEYEKLIKDNLKK